MVASLLKGAERRQQELYGCWSRISAADTAWFVHGQRMVAQSDCKAKTIAKSRFRCVNAPCAQIGASRKMRFHLHRNSAGCPAGILLRSLPTATTVSVAPAPENVMHRAAAPHLRAPAPQVG